MSHPSSGDFPLHDLSECVRSLDKVSRELSDVMTQQLNAVIAADAEKVMDLTEKNTMVQQRFHEKEQIFIAKLKQLISGSGSNADIPVTLSGLKQVYPGYTRYIEEWKQQISGNVDRLEWQHKQLIQLLDFAQEQNAALMRSVYKLQNEKNLHYGQNGKKTGVLSGMAVNQEG